MPAAGPVCVATIAGAHGVAGELKLVAHTEPAAALAHYDRLRLDTEQEARAAHCLRPWKAGWIARLEGIDSREQAAALAGRKLFVPREALGALADAEEFYHADLIGLEVVDTGGRVLGRVSAVHNHGAGDLIEVSGAGLKTPALLPFTRAVVPTIDLAAGRIVADPPEGVFPE